jgi:hypothetical protein
MRSPESTATVRRRYRCVASIYDWANLEGLLYADARARAIELLDLRPRARVLDVACGTGANFALIEQRIGPAGDLVVIPRPLAWALSRLFAADCSRRPWRLLQRETGDPTSERFTWGWVTAAAGAKGAA